MLWGGFICLHTSDDDRQLACLAIITNVRAFSRASPASRRSLRASASGRTRPTPSTDEEAEEDGGGVSRTMAFAPRWPPRPLLLLTTADAAAALAVAAPPRRPPPPPEETEEAGVVAVLRRWKPGVRDVAASIVGFGLSMRLGETRLVAAWMRLDLRRTIVVHSNTAPPRVPLALGWREHTGRTRDQEIRSRSPPPVPLASHLPVWCVRMD